MPLLLPKQRGNRREANFTGQPTTTWGTVLTSDAVAHTEPATPTELIASTGFNTDWVNIRFHTNGLTATITDSLVNIKVGAGGSEVNLMSNLIAGWVNVVAGTTPAMRLYGFPLRIPAGTRISATHRSVRTSTGVTCMIELLGGGDGHHWVGQHVESVGAVTGSSRGTTVTPGSGAEGTLTSIGTTTYDWGFVLPASMGNVDTTLSGSISSADLARGSATTDLIPGLEDFVTEHGAGEIQTGVFGGRYCHIPASSTLFLRSQDSTGIETKSHIIYGVA